MKKEGEREESGEGERERLAKSGRARPYRTTEQNAEFVKLAFLWGVGRLPSVLPPRCNRGGRERKVCLLNIRHRLSARSAIAWRASTWMTFWRNAELPVSGSARRWRGCVIFDPSFGHCGRLSRKLTRQSTEHAYSIGDLIQTRDLLFIAEDASLSDSICATAAHVMRCVYDGAKKARLLELGS